MRQQAQLDGFGDWVWELTHSKQVAAEASSAPNIDRNMQADAIQSGEIVVDSLGNIYMPNGNVISGTTGDTMKPSGEVTSGTGAIASDVAASAGRVAENLAQTATEALDKLGTIGKWIIVGVVALAVIEVGSKLPEGRRR